MLRVTIANIDQSFSGVFDTDEEAKAAELALADLVKNHEFFPDNYVHPCKSSEPDENAYGMLLMPGEEGEIEWKMDDENTYWVYVGPFVPNKLYGG